MNFFLILIIVCESATQGGSRPDNITNYLDNDINDFEYATTLDIFDLLQSILIREQPNQTINISSFWNSTNEQNDTWNIISLSLTTICIIVNMFTFAITYNIYIMQLPTDSKTYFPANTVDSQA